MSDEEIQLLGTKPAVAPTLQRPITGITLHINENSLNNRYRLSFERSSSVVHIGRRPGSESDSRARELDSARAMFRCAVVSRKHAKLAFSDSGQVYLIDQSSHHGTHLRKPDSLASTTLQPEVPVSLSDGDIVTFGKTVGRHDDCVEPVVARVELLRNPASQVLPTTPSSSSSSGRYGIYGSSSSDGYSSYDVDSDVDDFEEAPQPPFYSGFVPFGGGGHGQAFEVLKTLVPPSHPPTTADTGVLPLPLPPLPPQQQASEYVPGPRYESPPLEFWSSFFSPSPRLLPDDSIPFGVEDASRSSSPMDLESPASSPKLPNVSLARWDKAGPGEAENGESDLSSSSEDEDERDEPSQVLVEVAPVVVCEPSVSQGELQRVLTSVNDIQMCVDKLDNYRRKYRTRFNANVHRVSEKLSHTDDRLAEVNAQYDNLADKVEGAKNEITGFEVQLGEMSEELENVAYVDVPDLQSQVEEIERQVAAIRAKQVQDEDEKFQEERDNEIANHQRRKVVYEAEREMQGLKDLIEQMKRMREMTLQEMKNGLINVREVCQKTVEQVKERHVQVNEALAMISAEAPSSLSLKRKRDDYDELSEPFQDEDYPMEDDSSSIAASACDDGALSDEEASHPRKKRRVFRRVVSVVGRTAGAVTLGAVAAWSVLAFA